MWGHTVKIIHYSLGKWNMECVWAFASKHDDEAFWYVRSIQHEYYTHPFIEKVPQLTLTDFVYYIHFKSRLGIYVLAPDSILYDSWNLTESSALLYTFSGIWTTTTTSIEFWRAKNRWCIQRTRLQPKTTHLCMKNVCFWTVSELTCPAVILPGEKTEV